MDRVTIRIGVVDDHPVVLSGLHVALDAVDGLSVVAHARDVQGATELLHRRDIEVILLDIRLGEGNGLALLRDTLDVARPAVVVLSSFRTTQYIAAAIRFGAQGYVLKTAPLAELTDAIRRVAAGGSWFSAEQLRTSATGMIVLTPREREVLAMVLAGRSNDEIAGQLGTSRKTIEAHLSRLYGRFGAASRLELGLRAEREGWLELEPG